MISLQTAEHALKTYYLSAVKDQLDKKVSPFLAMIEQTENDISGGEFVKLVVNGYKFGVGAGTETGFMPKAGANQYGQIRLPLKNLFGRFEISDKAVRASQNSAGAFVNLLNAELEGLIRAAKVNMARMIAGDATGRLARILTVSGNALVLDPTEAAVVHAGMTVDVRDNSGSTIVAGAFIQRVVRNETGELLAELTGGSGSLSNVQCGHIIVSADFAPEHELTGLGRIFSEDFSTPLYGLDRIENPWLNPKNCSAGCGIDVSAMQDAFDHVEMNSGATPDIILCGYGARRAYIRHAKNSNVLNTNPMELDNGHKAITFCGVPMVADKFIRSDSMYFINSKDFKMHRLCDWRWLEGDGGSVLKQKQNEAAYTATLVKYAELVCDNPGAQAFITGISY